MYVSQIFSVKSCYPYIDIQRSALLLCKEESQKGNNHDAMVLKRCQREKRVAKYNEMNEFLKDCPNFKCDYVQEKQDSDCKEHCLSKHGIAEGVCFRAASSKNDFCLCGSDELARSKNLRDRILPPVND